MDYGGVNGTTEALNLLENFWPRITREIQNLTSSDFKNPELPLARIKKIMKLDDEVKMISAEAPIIFAKAAELFIQEVTIRAWLHTEENKRRTLQRNDVALAVSRYEQFDFLIDIVPREEINTKPSKSSKSESNSSPNSANSVQSNTNNNTINLQNATVMNAIVDPTTNLLNVLNGTGNNGGTAVITSNQATNGNNGVQYYFALPSNGIQNGGSLPLQLQNLSGIQTIQGLPNNIQTIQGLQGLQGLGPGAQIIINPNGQIISMASGNAN